MSLEVHTFVSGPLSTNAHVVLCSSSRKAWIIDAPEGIDSKIPVFLDQANASPQAIILTHSHWDHIAGAESLRSRLSIPIWVHGSDAPNCLNPGSDRVPCWIRYPATSVDRLLNNDEILTLGNTRWEVLHTPGHTPGGICLWCPAQKMLFSGDTLFKGTFGRTDLTTGNPAEMKASLARLAKLPEDTLVFPGHGESTLLGYEKWLTKSNEH
jgi:hydroxyacylglutathione hydrolase